MEHRCCITPYKEIRGGTASIYDYVREGYSVPDKVIAYLCTTEFYRAGPGMYEHPFKPDIRLVGPYMYTDGYYYWDRDTWKYVIKYHLTLPQDFIDHVMSDAGTDFIMQCIDRNEAWSNSIKAWKKKQGFVCFLPGNADKKALKDF